MSPIQMKLASLKFPKLGNSASALTSKLSRTLLFSRPYPKKISSIKSTLKSLPGILK